MIGFNSGGPHIGDAKLGGSVPVKDLTDVSDLAATLSRNMAKIRSLNSEPELLVRRLIHSLGYRYRLHKKDTLRKSDLVFGLRKKVIFVHGCYWHVHLR